MIDWFNIFGTHIHFTIFNKPKYYTIIGLLSSILTFILIIVFTILLGSDLFFKRNPFIISSKYKSMNHSYMNISSEQLYIPWRIIDKNRNTISSNLIIYPILFYIKSNKDPITNIITSSREFLSINTCQSNIINSTSLNISIDQYQCFNFTNVLLGGNSMAEKFNYLSFGLAYCPEGEEYNYEECDSNNYLLLDSIANSENPWSLSLMYPEHFFDPNNNEEPMKIIYKELIIPITSLYSNPLYIFEFQHVSLIDDVGIIISNQKETNVFSTYNDGYRIENSKKTMGNFSSIFQKVDFTISKDHDIYSRKYVKLTEVLANIGGVMRLIINLFQLICFITNEFFLYTSLLEHFFVFEHKHTINANIQSCNNNTFHNKTINNNNQSQGFVITEIHLSSSINKSTFNANNKISNFKKEKGQREDVKKNLNEASKNKEMQNKQKKSICSLLPNYIIVQILILKCFQIKQKKSSRHVAFTNAINGIQKRLEINEYIKSMNECQLMKRELLDNDMINKMRQLQKINAFNDNEMNYIYEKSMYNYSSKKVMIEQKNNFNKPFNSNSNNNINDSHLQLMKVTSLS